MMHGVCRDYSLTYSWMIGREIADPFYSTVPAPINSNDSVPII